MGKKHELEVWIEAEVIDKSGKVIQRHRQKSRTWVRNWIVMLNRFMKNSGASVTKQDGTGISISYSIAIGTMLKVNAGAGIDTWGILVGSGTTPYSPDDYALANKIPNGTGDGQLSYGATQVFDVVDDGTSLSFKIVRTFSNEGSVNVTVNEVGLAVYANGYNILVARDVLSSSISVPAGSSLVIRYIVKLTYA